MKQCVSDRHHRRLFRDNLGASPKTVARIERLRRAVNVMTSSTLPLSDVAAMTGYFDQAHLNRDFRAMIGSSPIAFQSNLAPIAGRFNAFEANPQFDRSSY